MNHGRAVAAPPNRHFRHQIPQPVPFAANRSAPVHLVSGKSAARSNPTGLAGRKFAALSGPRRGKMCREAKPCRSGRGCGQTSVRLMPTTFAVLGSGGWGTAIAVLLAQNPDHRVRLWGAHPQTVRRAQRRHARTRAASRRAESPIRSRSPTTRRGGRRRGLLGDRDPDRVPPRHARSLSPAFAAPMCRS